MNIQDLQQLYALLPQVGALCKVLEDKSAKTVFLQGLVASATPMFFASVAQRWQKTILFVLNDNDEAGYFYNDLKTIAMPEDGKGQTAEVLFFPSSYRRAVKYGQRDAETKFCAPKYFRGCRLWRGRKHQNRREKKQP